VLPIALALALASLAIFGQDPKWDADRATTRVVDPLVFGYFSLAFGLMCLVSLSPADWSRGRRWGVLLRAAGVVLGVYLSIRSGSRTGWLALPIVIALWGHHHWGRGRPLATAAVLAAAVLLPLLAYLLVPVVGMRVDTAIRQILDYPWHGGVLRGMSSAGYRIAFLRMAVDLLALHPWAGVGDTSHVAPLPPEVFPYVGPEVVAQAFGAGFHNQVVSNAVRMGIGGLLATTALLLMPLLVCWRACRKGPAAVQGDALMGLAYCTCVLVSSVSTEVVDLKYAASFYAVMTAAFCGAVLAARGERAGPA
jgi:O-antigen ligase